MNRKTVSDRQHASDSVEPFLQICIPTFNRAAHLDCLLGQLSEAISVCNFDPGSSFDVGVFVSDNSSTDLTREVLSKWRSRMPSWTLVSQDHNVGMMDNFEFLIANSSATYCWLLGDDDRLAETFSLMEVLRGLKSYSPGLMILGTPGEDSSFASTVFFERVQSYVRFVAKEDPDFLRRHTWITANIFRRAYFDFPFARAHRKGWYAHMYGIFRGLRNSKAGVLVSVGDAVEASESPGFREPNFPNMKLMRQEWSRYFAFLSLDFRQPNLLALAFEWHPGPRYLIDGYLSKLARSRFLRYVRSKPKNGKI